MAAVLGVAELRASGDVESVEQRVIAILPAYTTLSVIAILPACVAWEAIPFFGKVVLAVSLSRGDKPCTVSLLAMTEKDTSQ